MGKKYREVNVFLRRWWHLAAPFWRSDRRKTAIWMINLAMLFNIINIALAVRMNQWSRDFFNALQDRNSDEFFYQLGILFVLAGISLFLYSNQRYLCKKTVIIWREWLSAHYTKQWLTTKTYYREIFYRRIDNPDQRIAEDLHLFPSLTISMIFDFVDSIGSFGAFAVILWGLSENYPLFGITIPGIMLWLVIFFVVVGSWLVHLVGHPLIGLERQSQRYEANYRYRLLRIREKAKEIAAYGGEDREVQDLSVRFRYVFKVWIKTILKERHLNYFLQGYSQISGVVPYLIAAPKYFAGTFQMGDLMQTTSAFNGVRVALSWFIFNYSRLTDWKATVDRLTEFDEIFRNHVEQSAFVRIGEGGNDLILDDVVMTLPDNQCIARISVIFSKGKRYALRGPSGSGKTTLFYVLRDMWPLGKGRISMPQGKQLFISQNPYLPEGTLLSVLAYPTLDEPTIEEGVKILKAVGLEYLTPKLKESQHWEQVLSPGEQQRIALGRVWVQKPDWLFLDEALSAVDRQRRESVLANLQKDFPHISVVSIVHEEVGSFYDEIISWEVINSEREDNGR